MNSADLHVLFIEMFFLIERVKMDVWDHTGEISHLLYGEVYYTVSLSGRVHVHYQKFHAL